MWSDWNHDFIYKGPANIKNDDEVNIYSLAMADYFWKLDEERRALPMCPQIMKNANSLKILREGVAGDHAEATYKKLGYPPNACYWWNDMKLALPEQQCPKAASSDASMITGTRNVFGSLLLAGMMSTLYGSL